MNDKEHPAEPGADGNGTARGGFAKAAEHLNRLYPIRTRPISRQLVHKWWINRHSNAFPDAVDSTGSPGTSGGRGRPLFDLSEVENWYARYLDTRRHTSPRTQAQHITPGEPPVNGDTMAA